MELEFLKSRTNSWVPLVEGTLLHSSVDPEREAENFIASEWDNLKNVRSVIVLGLGGGFHVQELLKRKAFDVVVIEASKNLVVQIGEKNPHILETMTLLAGLATDLIFKDSDILVACSRSFTVLKHPASFRLQHFYYAAILKEFNRRTINGLKKTSKGNEKIVHFFESLDINGDQLLTLPMIEEAMQRRGTGLGQEGLIWMTMRELIE
jgi:hypothetical protein